MDVLAFIHSGDSFIYIMSEGFDDFMGQVFSRFGRDYDVLAESLGE